MVSEKLIHCLGFWINESDFKYEVDEDDMVTMLGFSTESEKEDTFRGITHEVMAEFRDWCIVKLGYDSFAIEAMIKDFLEIPQNGVIRYWE